MTAVSDKKNSSLMPISDREFDLIRKLVYDRFGINLTEKKRSLLVGRLQKLLKTQGYDSFRRFYDAVLADRKNRLLDELVNRVSTNHTFFYREKHHFDFFRNVALPQITERLQKENSRDIRIWCAGCSTGEEPFTLIIEMMEYFKSQYVSWDAGILATDISGTALEKARRGEYTDERLNGVSNNIRGKYFSKTASGWKVKDEVMKEVTFRRFNLMNSELPFKNTFHMIFCRNVMIYFDQPTREALVNRFYRQTCPGGYLYIGHSESLRRDACPYEYVKPAVYRRTENG